MPTVIPDLVETVPASPETARSAVPTGQAGHESSPAEHDEPQPGRVDALLRQYPWLVHEID